MTRSALTILTDPLPAGRDFFQESARRMARYLKYEMQGRIFDGHRHYRGHFAVTRSLIAGLERIGVDFNYNPNRISQLAESVVVLAGVRTLRQAIRLKRQGIIRKLVAGPNIVHFSSDFQSILAEPEVDAIITPSDWVAAHYIADNPSLWGRVFSWPAGVDARMWVPEPTRMPQRILIFDKRTGSEDPHRVRPYIEYLRGRGWAVDVLEREIGKNGYTQGDYLSLLQRACLMVGFTVGSESQGIAWAEAWSADVPTLILKNTQQMFYGRNLTVSTAPYLCEQNGLFFNDLDHFKHQFAHWEAHRNQFVARDWLLKNMSDEACARQLYERVLLC
jgi:hypothetical protein